MTEPRRIGVFIDYWYAYTTARQVFAPPGPPAPPWFGNVLPALLAQHIIKSPPIGQRRSERELGGTHVFIRHFEPENSPGQLRRVQQWEAQGVAVSVGPSPEATGRPHPAAVGVALAASVAAHVAGRRYDAAVVVAGDGALIPLFSTVNAVVGASVIEVASWVAADGMAPSALTNLPDVWCHRLGEATFRVVVDDVRRAPQRPLVRSFVTREPETEGGPSLGGGPDRDPVSGTEARDLGGCPEPPPKPMTGSVETPASTRKGRRGIFGRRQP